MAPAQNLNDLCTDLLPKLLQNFVGWIGLTPTMAIVQAYGGVRIYIPKHASADHPLCKLIGLENLEILCAEMGGEEHVHIPKAEAALRHLRDEKIRADFGPKSLRQLALEHRLTERMICYIIGANPAGNAAQNSLFG